MRIVIQRVAAASVTVDDLVVGSIGTGVCLLVGVGHDDTAEEAAAAAAKIGGLRVFPDEEGRMNRSLLDIAGEALVVSQFTLLADTRKGRRPSFTDAASADRAEPVIEAFCKALRDQGVTVATGVFGAKMSVELVNDGPVTIVVDIADGAVR